MTSGNELFTCPESTLPLAEVDLRTAEQLIAGGRSLSSRLNKVPPPIGPTATIMIRSDYRCGYPIVDGVPVLISPEMLVAPEDAVVIDLDDPRFCEAYREMDHYNAIAVHDARHLETSVAGKFVQQIRELDSAERLRFPMPASVWVNSSFDGAAELDAYTYLGKLEGARVLQIGGGGLHAVKFLLAGCNEAVVVSPMLGELSYARRLAELAGLAKRLRCAAGVAEGLPLASESIDVIFTVGCLHHMQTEMAMPEFARVLAPGGKFVAVEPWRAPLYSLGTGILGKRCAPLFGSRNIGVFCRPMNAERVEPLHSNFSRAEVIHHGTLTRYLLLALWKCGLRMTPSTIRRIIDVDDRICSIIPGLRRHGSIVALTASK